MAHIVGVPKREPCQECGNPVFFAERLTIGEFLYHRTCLKCARCGSQLTLGSFYETENDGVYCCETCPDEEKKIQLSQNNNNDKHKTEQQTTTTTEEIDPHRQSFSEKIAKFQTNGKGLLQKSVSDEEKSKSLKRLSELGLFSKISNQDGKCSTLEVVASSENGSTTSGGRESDSSSDSEVSDDDGPPVLPKTMPPTTDSDTITHLNPVQSKSQLPPIPSKANVLNKLKMQPSPIKSLSDTNRGNRQSFQLDVSPKIASIVKNDQTSQLVSLSNKENENEINQQEAPAPAPTPINIKILDTPHIECSAENKEEMTLMNNVNDIISSELPSDASNSRNDVTKEINKIAQEMTVEDDVNSTSNDIDFTTSADHTNAAAQATQADSVQCEQTEENAISISSAVCNESKLNTISNNDKQLFANNPDNDASIDDSRIRSNSTGSNHSNNQMVRSRLSQFESLLQSESRQPTHKCTDSPRLNRSPLTIESRTKPLEQNEILSLASHEKNATDIESEQGTNVPIRNNEIESMAICNDNDMNNEDTLGEKPIPLKRTAKIISHLDTIETLPPTPTKMKNRTSAVDQGNHSENQEQSETTKEEQDNARNEALSAEGETENHAPEYPDDLNPFGCDDEEEEEKNNASIEKVEIRRENIESQNKRKDSLNPFDSSDDEVELLKETPRKKTPNTYRMSTNPFGSESEDETESDTMSIKRTPVPTPRKAQNGSSLNSTPEPSPRMSHTLNPKMRLSSRLHADFDDTSSIASSSNYSRMSYTLNRSNMMHGSMSSLSSTPRHKKGRAPDIPVSNSKKLTVSANSSPSHSVRATPLSKKKRAAPKPPMPSKNLQFPDFHSTPDSNLGDSMDMKELHESLVSEESLEFERSVIVDYSTESPYISTSAETSIHTTDASSLALTGVKSDDSSTNQNDIREVEAPKTLEKRDSQRKLIPVDSSLLDEFTIKNIAERTADENINYRRKIVAESIITPIKQVDRQCEKMKENKESQNKNRQSQIVMPVTLLSDEMSQVFSPNKSSHGKWKRRKGPAPLLPVPPRKVIQMLPLQEIRHELEVIEVQQQGLEKQGVILEKMIRERCEGTENENKPLDEFKPNTKEVEDLILQLFELVNEKNELFRRQAELMYLRRQHRLEQEQADIEYEIRVLMAQPECNKTDSDKAREEALISRLVEVVQLRNEVIESLEMDRIREAEEDQSIKERLELHTAKRDEELCPQTPTKLSKKEKKKQKESKKLAKQKKVDADKDADESEIGEMEKVKEKRKKKKFLF